jgi:hypothetical protein
MSNDGLNGKYGTYTTISRPSTACAQWAEHNWWVCGEESWRKLEPPLPSSNTPHATDYFSEFPKVPPTALCRLPAATNQVTLDPGYPWNLATQEQSLVHIRRTNFPSVASQKLSFPKGTSQDLPTPHPHHSSVLCRYGLSEGSDRLPIKQP